MPELNNPIPREFREQRQNFLPLAGGVLLVLSGVVIILLLRERVQVAMVSDVMFTVWILLPLLLCLGIVYVILVLAIVLLGRAHNLTTRSLRRVDEITQSVNNRTMHMDERTRRAVLVLSTFLEPFGGWLGVFDEMPLKTDEEADGKIDD